MGTRADFYIGRGPDALWLGSIAWDGYPSGIDQAIVQATTEQDFTARLNAFWEDRDDVTLPKDGWPWPWTTSATTDYAYALDGGKVYASCFGGPWFDPLLARPDDEQEENEDEAKGPRAEFPDMTTRQKVTLGKRSGVMIFTR